MNKLYFFNDKGIITLVKTLVTNFISSKYYTDLLDKISLLTTKVDNITENNGSIDIVSAVYTPGLNASRYNTINNSDRSRTYKTILDSPYPSGFDMNNSIIVASGVMASNMNDSREYHYLMPMQIDLRENYIDCRFTIDPDTANYNFNPSALTLYFMKAN